MLAFICEVAKHGYSQKGKLENRRKSHSVKNMGVTGSFPNILAVQLAHLTCSMRDHPGPSIGPCGREQGLSIATGLSNELGEHFTT